MKRLILLTWIAALLAGCVAVPVADPGPVYVAPVVRPYFYYGYERHEGFHHERHWR